MKKKLGIILAVVATAVVTAVSLVGCSNVKKMKSQIDALIEVKSGQSEMAIIDSTMAGYLLNTDSSFNDLAIIDLEDFKPEAEQYGVAAQKDKKALINFINSQLIKVQNDGGYDQVATKYGLGDRTIDMSWTATEIGDWKSQLNDKNQKEVVVAYTMNAPMAIEKDGKITGFDIELAEKVFEGTGVTVKTKLIEWDSKELELNSGKIDLVWNGMTITDERLENMAVSIPYLTNEQSIVVLKSNVEKYKKVLDLDGIKIAAEKGSAGQAAAKELDKMIKELKKNA